MVTRTSVATPFSLPKRTPSATNVVTQAGASWHVLALKNDGTVLAWGKNDYGQTNVPTWLGGVCAVAAGQNHSLALCVIDSDGDGLPDNWERHYFGDLSQTGSGDYDGDGFSNFQEYQNGTDPKDFFNGALPILEIVNTNYQILPVDNYLAVSLNVQATDTNGVALYNAPLMFAVSEGTMQLSASANGTLSNNLVLRTDAGGHAIAWLFLPTNSFVTNYMTVTAASGTNQLQMQLAIGLNDVNGPFFIVQTLPEFPPLPVAEAAKAVWLNYADMPHLITPGGGGTNDLYATEFAHWVIHDLPMPDGSPLTWDALEAQRQSNLLALSTNIYNDYVNQQAAVSSFLQANTNVAGSWTDADGNTVFIDSLDPLGAPLVKVPFNLESAQTVGAQNLWPGGSTGFNINGTNVLIGLWDSGYVQTNHQEFWKAGFNVSLLNAATSSIIDPHSTFMAGTLAAWGVSNNAIGFANRAKVLASLNKRDFVEMPSVVATNAMRVSNHSYGIAGGWYQQTFFGTNAWLWSGNISISTNQDWKFGFYEGRSQTNDAIIYTAQTYLPVFACGDQRGPGPYQPPTQPFNHWEYVTIGGTLYYSYTTAVRPLNDAQNGFNNLTSYAVGKNDLVVGAVTVNTNGYTGTNSVVMSTFSDWGPTADGRIKPDICAVGVAIYSTYAVNQTVTNQYATGSGTSMSAPAVAGTIGLLTQLYQQLYPTNAPLLSGTNAPLSSTLAGIVVHTADQTGTNLGPNYMFGWGQLNALSAANLISNNFASGSLAFIKEVRLVSGDYIEFPIVLTNTQPFKATIRWTDPPGTPTAVAVNPTNHMLVNDLDLRVVSPGGVTNFPWVLNPSSPASAATKADNAVDNVEQVSIPSPTNGTHMVRVTHKGSLLNDLGQTNYQNVSLMLSGNIAQPPILPLVASIAANTTSNTVALKWPSEVGRVYRVQYENDISSGSWQYATGEMSATKTNTTVVLSVTGVTNRFYRIVQLR